MPRCESILDSPGETCLFDSIQNWWGESKINLLPQYSSSAGVVPSFAWIWLSSSREESTARTPLRKVSSRNVAGQLDLSPVWMFRPGKLNCSIELGGLFSLCSNPRHGLALLAFVSIAMRDGRSSLAERQIFPLLAHRVGTRYLPSSSNVISRSWPLG